MLTIKTQELRNWTYLTLCSTVSIVNFEHVTADWEISFVCYIVSSTQNTRIFSRPLVFIFRSKFKNQSIMLDIPTLTVPQRTCPK